MTAKINLHSIVAFLALLVAISLGAASVASADEGPPPLPSLGELGELPGGGEVPPAATEGPGDPVPPKTNTDVDPEPPKSNTGTAPVTEIPPSQDVKILKARIVGGKLAVSLSCAAPGTVRVSGGGAQPFSCVSGKAAASLRLSGKQRRSMSSGYGLHVSVLISSGGSVTRAPLTIRRRSAGPGHGTARTSSAGYWNGVHSSCTAYSRAGGGDLMRIDTTSSNGFGIAAPHETVYWRALVFEYSGGRWIPYAHNWESYGVTTMAGGSSGDGYMVVGGGGFEMNLEQAFNISGGVWTIPAVEVWSQRAGYHWAWVGPNMEAFGAQTSGPFCYAN